ncbi:MAG: hypothetical protein H7Z38_10055, partial [Rubrivivax sp.]|nr:hypothetical protein [Pyrinomonadaceae bacterium]
MSFRKVSGARSLLALMLLAANALVAPLAIAGALGQPAQGSATVALPTGVERVTSVEGIT